MEEWNFTMYRNPELIDDYKKAADANVKALGDFDKAAAVFLKFKDADSRKILEQVLDNVQNTGKLKTELAVRLADNIVDPLAWKTGDPVEDRRRAAKAAADAIRRREAGKAKRLTIDDIELKA